MTIGKSSKKNKAPRSPPFLDRASGFYGRLDEAETEVGKEVETKESESQTKPGAGESSKDEQEHAIFDFSEGMMEDDGATLLQRKPSRLSRRWSRKSSRRTKSEQKSRRAETEAVSSVDQNVDMQPESRAEPGPANAAPEPMLVHFSIREEADDQMLISATKERQVEMDEKKRGGETEEKSGGENMKVVKSSTLKNYRKAFDRALRRGWETFVANLHSVTLTPVSSSSSSSSSPTSSTVNRNAALAEYR
ncbi:uncharacterized protein [Salminus brasiliensis]|uniref:uncharacterized protein n=1 Tax=Salminus brasiliensis TaxID=930266 RepID=UPI003B834BC1